jgi:hypothetical protein
VPGADALDGALTPAAASPARPDAPSAGRSLKADPELDAVLARVSEYLDAYLRDFSNVVAEEDYKQRLVTPGMPSQRVRLRSDLLLLRTAGPDGWTPFRDVFEVNDIRVRDREDRLRKLFLEQPGRAMAEARRITEESARYNIGNIHRTTNLPTLPLAFLLPAHLPAFRFERRREEAVEGSRVLRIDYQEVGRPTVIRDRNGVDRPSSGSLWVDPATGRIVKTAVSNKSSKSKVVMEATVVYRRSATLGLWAPAEMTERYGAAGSSWEILGEAKYGNFRRFQVSTQETVAVPKSE